jgi:hypothetical protein
MKRFCLCLLLAACTDPRARPVAPIVQVSFASNFRLTSPGQVLGSLHMFDTDGLRSVDLSVRSADSSFVGDSTILLTGDQEITRPVTWCVPRGLAVGSSVTLVSKVAALTGFIASDTVRLIVQDTLGTCP